MTKKYTPKYKYSVNERDIYIFDNISDIREIQSIYQGMEQSAFKRNEIARPDTQNYKHWAVNLSEPQINNLPLYQKIVEAIRENVGYKYRCYRGYCNYASFGDMLFTHTDCLPQSKELTALVYICPEWNVEWGGETLFYNEEKDCVYACTPKPGRVVLFDGAITHVGRPPNKIYVGPRYTLAFKLELVD